MGKAELNSLPEYELQFLLCDWHDFHCQASNLGTAAWTVQSLPSTTKGLESLRCIWQKYQSVKKMQKQCELSKMPSWKLLGLRCSGSSAANEMSHSV